VFISRSVTCPIAFPKRSQHGYSLTLSISRFRLLNSLVDHFIGSVCQEEYLSVPDYVIAGPLESKATSNFDALREERATGKDLGAKTAGGRHRCLCIRIVSRAHFEVRCVSNRIPHQLFSRVQRDTINFEIMAPERAFISLVSVSLQRETLVYSQLCNLVSP